MTDYVQAGAIFICVVLILAILYGIGSLLTKSTKVDKLLTYFGLENDDPKDLLDTPGDNEEMSEFFKGLDDRAQELTMIEPHVGEPTCAACALLREYRKDNPQFFRDMEIELQKELSVLAVKSGTGKTETAYTVMVTEDQEAYDVMITVISHVLGHQSVFAAQVEMPTDPQKPTSVSIAQAMDIPKPLVDAMVNNLVETIYMAYVKAEKTVLAANGVLVKEQN